MSKKDIITGFVFGDLRMVCNACLSRFGWLKGKQVAVGVRAWGRLFVRAEVAIASFFVRSCLRFISD